jgi:hypothetical protein
LSVICEESALTRQLDRPRKEVEVLLSDTLDFGAIAQIDNELLSRVHNTSLGVEVK